MTYIRFIYGLYTAHVRFILQKQTALPSESDGLVTSVVFPKSDQL